MSSEPAASRSTELFGAFRGQPPRRGIGVRLLMLSILAGTGTWAALQSEERNTRVVTPFGIRAVQQGMTQQDVLDILGKPIATDDRGQGNVQCFRYGRPTLESPTFVLYSICYENGKLKDIVERRYASWIVAPDGSLQPPNGTPDSSGNAPEPAGNSLRGAPDTQPAH